MNYRSMINQILAPVLRKSFKMPDGIFDESFSVKTVETWEEFLAAQKLLHDSYVHKGLMEANPLQMRLMPHHLLPETNIIVVKRNDCVVGTATVIHRHHSPFPSESIFKNETSSLEAMGYDLTEVSALAVHPDFRGQNNLIQLLFSKYYINLMNRIYSQPHTICSTHPKAELFYKTFYDFARTGDEASYSFVKNAKAAFLHGDISINRLRQLTPGFRSGDDSDNFIEFVLSDDERMLYPDFRAGFIASPTRLLHLAYQIYPHLYEIGALTDPKNISVVESVEKLLGIPHQLKTRTLFKPRAYRLKTQLQSLQNGVDVLNISSHGTLIAVPGDAIIDNTLNGISLEIETNSNLLQIEGRIARLQPGPKPNQMLIALHSNKEIELVPEFIGENIKKLVAA